MSKHTPGILRTCGNSKCSCNLLWAENGDTIGTWYGDDDKSIEGVTVQCPDVETGRANGHRLRDCWNACTGMSDPDKEIKALREVAEAQIAADDAIDAYEKDDDLDPEVLGAALRRRRQAIDAYRTLAALKAEGEVKNG